MARMTAAAAAVLVMEKEGITVAFGVPDANRWDYVVLVQKSKLDDVLKKRAELLEPAARK